MVTHLGIRSTTDNGEASLRRAKRLEWVFIAVRWLYVPAIFVMAALHNPSSPLVMHVLGAAMAVANIAACLLNWKASTRRAQTALGIAMLSVDALLGWGVILLFVGDFYTSAYAAFALVIMEGAVRFSLAGSLAMGALFVIGLSGAWLYRAAALDVRFSVSGYVFWTVIMSLIALAVGFVVREGRKQQELAQRLAGEKTLLLERKRISQELHDGVLKSLHGLALEAHVLQREQGASATVLQKAQYIEQICQQTSREIKELVFDLRGEEETDCIGARLSGMLGQWSSATGTTGEFALSGTDSLVPAKVAHDLCRVLGEALTNVQRHSGASHVNVSLAIRPQELSLVIQDDGRGIGFRVEDIYSLPGQGKLGLAFMKERVESEGGRFRLESDSHGTSIHAAIPLNAGVQG
ncbi:MAG: sensor histidine kinase [Dehalococcoidales bacterium]|nr:sensor histidine kinase [Dehalococcoidales bacterium]